MRAITLNELRRRVGLKEIPKEPKTLTPAEMKAVRKIIKCWRLDPRK